MNINKSNKADETSKVFEVEVTRAHAQDEKHIFFDACVNGVMIYGMTYIEYSNQNGEGSLIGFPSQKGKDDKWYNRAFFPISAELKENIIKQLEAKLS